MSVSDTALLQRWQEKRDADAFTEIVSRHSHMVYATCVRVLRNAAEAEDAAQECFLELLNSDVAITSSLASWLHTVAFRRALNRARTSGRRRRREQRFAEERDKPKQILVDDLTEHVDEAIAGLPEKLRAPLVCRFLEGDSYEGIARDQGVAESTVRYRANKALEKVRTILKRRGIPTGVAALAAMLESSLAEAVPATLMASLGKVAVAGTSASVMTETVGTVSTVTLLKTVGGVSLMAKKVIAGCAALVVVLGLFYSLSEQDEEQLVEEKPVTADTLEEFPEFESVVPSARAERTAKEIRVSADSTELKEEAAPVRSISLPATASVSGHVLDERGGVFPEAKVELHIGTDLMCVDIKETFQTESDSDGAYEFADMDVFGYGRVYASAQGYLKSASSVSINEIKAGDRRANINLSLAEAPFYVAGWVVSESREPVEGAFVNLAHYGYDEESLLKGRSGGISNFGKTTFEVTDAEGYFEMPIREEGLCDFHVIKDGYGTSFFPRVMTGTHDVTFVLRSSGSISGTVTRSDGEAAIGVRVRAAGEVPAGGVEVTESDNSLCPGFDTTFTDENGDYTISGLGEDYVYTVFASDPSMGSGKFGSIHTGWADWVVGRREEEGPASREGPNLKRGVLVRAGMTTPDVNLSFAPATRISGRVTSDGSGTPVHPLLVIASPEGVDDPLGEGYLANTDQEGRYSIACDISSPASFRVMWMYIHMGGASGGPQPVDDMVVEISPGEQREYDFTIAGPVTVLVQFVAENGEPRTDVFAAIRKNPGSGSGSSGRMAVDDEGRVVIVGLPPGKETQIVGLLNDPAAQQNVVVGTSAVFVGEPGEIMDELTVVCIEQGGLEGVLVDSAGNPIARKQVHFVAVGADGFLSETRRARTNPDGVFSALTALPQGTSSVLYILYRGPEGLEWAVVENVRIETGAITDLGELKGVPVADEEAQEIFGHSIIHML